MIQISLLSSYLYCPRKIFLEHVLRLSEPSKDILLKGKIRHETYELINKIDKDIIVGISQGLTRHEIYNLFRKEYTELLKAVITRHREKLAKHKQSPSYVFRTTMPLFMQEARIRADNISSFMEKKGLSGEELWENLVPKIRSEYPLESEKLGLRGVVDILKVYDDTVMPLEIKLGNPPKEGVWPGHRIQLAAIMMLIEENFGISQSRGMIDYQEAGEQREIILNPFMRQEVLDTRQKIQKIFDLLELPQRITSDKKCEACGLRDKCMNEAYLGVLARDMRDKAAEAGI